MRSIRVTNRLRSHLFERACYCCDYAQAHLLPALAAILHIFNYSLQSGRFPDLWKIANVKPLPKKTGACVVKDFRPISLLCTLGKALEKMVHAQAVDFLLRNSLLNPLQSGFRSNHSTSTALLKVIGDIRKNFDNQQLSLLVLYDFSNAFPSVHHDLLLTKLRLYGLSASVISWFQSYLTGRAQRVVNEDDISTLLPLMFGVPQGSVLGPLLYCLYVNDIHKVFSNSSYHLYADDLQNYVSFDAPDSEKAVHIINEEASKLVNYSKGHRF
jgi:retron-type reverse transcriptase